MWCGMIQRIIITLVFNCDGEQNAHLNTMKHSTGLRCVIWQKNHSRFCPSWCTSTEQSPTLPNSPISDSFARHATPELKREHWSHGHACFSDPEFRLFSQLFLKRIFVWGHPLSIFFFKYWKKWVEDFFLMK